MIPFPEAHATALRDLLSAWDSGRFIVIGAAAIGRHLDLHWRETFDLDLSVAAGVDAYTQDLERLGWRQDSASLQRWLTPEGFRVDILPGDPTLVSRGGFTWPDGSAQMSLVGFRLAFADALPLEIGPGASVRVASLRSLLLLKLAAYLDQPWTRDTDLGDIAHILSGYLGMDSPQRWDEGVVALGLDFEDVGPYLLAKELGGMVDESERKLVKRFLDTIEDPADRFATLHRMAERAPAGWKDPDRLRERLTAFRRGFGS